MHTKLNRLHMRSPLSHTTFTPLRSMRTHRYMPFHTPSHRRSTAMSTMHTLHRLHPMLGSVTSAWPPYDGVKRVRLAADEN